MKIIEVVNALERFAPLPLQEDYDNAGLQIGLTEAEISGALLCLDVTEETVDEAIRKGCNLIVSHHPLIFRRLRRIAGEDMVQRVVAKAIVNHIAIVSMHTNMDAAQGGVNFKIAEKMGLSHVGFIGKTRQAEAHGASADADAMVAGGEGVMGEWDEPMAADDFIQMLKQTFGVECVMANQLLRRPIRKVALCGGAGSFMLDEAIARGADAFVTGEMSYHQYFGHEQEIQIAVIGHYQSEQFTTEIFKTIIEEQCEGVKCEISAIDTNPIIIFNTIMVKKSPTELTVEEKLQALYQLQVTLSAIDEKRALRGELPLEVQDLADELEGLKTRVEKIEGDINEFQSAVTAKKGEIAKAQAGIERYKEQLNDVKNNREYDTLTKEIEFQSLEVELCNKKIKDAIIRIDEKKKELEQTKEIIADRTEALAEKRGELDEIMQETRDDEEKLKARARELEAKIEPRLLASFKRIRKSARNGLGITVEQRDACGGCNNKIPPQRQIDIKMHKKIIVCEYCGRIMIDSELAGIKEDVEEKPKKRATRKKKTEDAE